jgi:hypothetical protein
MQSSLLKLRPFAQVWVEWERQQESFLFAFDGSGAQEFSASVTVPGVPVQEAVGGGVEVEVLVEEVEVGVPVVEVEVVVVGGLVVEVEVVVVGGLVVEVEVVVVGGLVVEVEVVGPVVEVEVVGPVVEVEVVGPVVMILVPVTV